jgi:hypothetical protein
MHETETRKAGTRALTVVAANSRPVATPPRNAAFVAHLIATRAQAPQTRVKRRAEPAEAVAVYRRVAGLCR